MVLVGDVTVPLPLSVWPSQPVERYVFELNVVLG